MAIGFELVYGQQTGNAGQLELTNYNDLDETAYSVKFTYGGFEADYRKNDADNSGLVRMVKMVMMKVHQFVVYYGTIE